MTPEEFNSWRREFDYPRIISFLKDHLTCFPDWIQEQNVTDEDLLEFAPAVFLREAKNIKIYELKGNDGVRTREIRPSNHSVGEVIFHQKKVEGKKIIVPYFEWVKSNNKRIKSRECEEFSINSRKGRNASILLNLELVVAGNVRLPVNFMFGHRDLEFLNLDNLTIESVFSNTFLKIWYSSAINLTIVGDLAFVDAYKTPFTDGWATRTRSLKLKNGNFQSWSFKDCVLNFKATNSVLHLWKVEGNDFQCTLEHSDLKDCHFQEGSTKLGAANKKACQFHRTVKRIYSQVGDHSKAGEHFYKERCHEQKSLMRPTLHYWDDIQKEKNVLKKCVIYLLSYMKFSSLAFQNLLWGFGERPSRVFSWALFVIVVSAAIYNYNPHSSTFKDVINSIYFSLVTFTTLGYGEIIQQDTFLKVYASIESLLGLTLMALVVAGFSSKSKDY